MPEYTFDRHERRLWRVLKNKGMLKLAKVAQPCEPRLTEVWVDFQRPDIEVVGGMGLSTHWSIEYAHEELPKLVEDAELTIDGELYRVRQPPTVEEGGTGFFRFAILSKECP